MTKVSFHVRYKIWKFFHAITYRDNSCIVSEIIVSKGKNSDGMNGPSPIRK